MAKEIKINIINISDFLEELNSLQTYDPKVKFKKIVDFAFRNLYHVKKENDTVNIARAGLLLECLKEAAEKMPANY